MANPSKYRLPPAELSSHRGVVVVVVVAAEGGEEVGVAQAVIWVQMMDIIYS